jgi:two-component system, OmpR family, response regulator
MPCSATDVGMNGHTRTHVLVVDDDREIVALLRGFLERHGFRASGAADAREARQILAQDRIDLVVLDLMLPNESGLDLCRALRTTSGVPVIMLTALGEVTDRVRGLATGADDYVCKPFDPQELLERIRAVLRRSAAAHNGNVRTQAKGYRFDDWRLDVTSRTLRDRSGREVSLNGADFRLLCVLLSHAPCVLSRARLMELVRGRDFDPFDRSIDVRVSRLRQTFGEDARSPRIIQTVYGEGYAIGVPVQVE